MSFRALSIGLVVIIALLSAGPAEAQTPSIPGNLYLTSTLGTNNPAGCANSDRYAMSEVAPEAGKAYTAPSAGVACALSFDYVAGYSGVLSGEQTLTMAVGCDYGGAMIEIDYTFAVAGLVLGTERTSNPTWTCSSSASFPYVKTFDGKDTPVEPETLMRLTISVFVVATGEPGTPTGNFHVKVGGDDPARLTGVGMPGSVVAALDVPSVLYENVTGPAFAVEDIKAAFNGSVVYNWTTNLTSAVLGYAVSASAGNLTFTLVDGANTTVASEPLNGTAERPLTSLVPGNWTVRLDYTNFTGNVSVSLGAVPDVGPTVEPDTNGTTNGTAALNEGKDKGSPGLALPVILTLLAAFVAVVRRGTAP